MGEAGVAGFLGGRCGGGGGEVGVADLQTISYIKTFDPKTSKVGPEPV